MEKSGKQQSIRLIELYASVQGESTLAGRPCVFVRTAGCNLRCSWCDSTWTFTGGEHRSFDDIVEELHRIGIPLVELTGGEPLIHKASIPLLQRFVDEGFEVMLETSGSISIERVPKEVHIVLDLKAPDSDEEGANLLENLDHLKPSDDVKLVLASRRDYEWAREMTATHELGRFNLLFSPVHGSVDPADLANWIVEDRLPGRLQLQMHKFIWPPETRGV